MILLSPLGWIYGLAMDIRNALYDRGWLMPRSLGARTISVGNITAGGTGKTPLVALVAGILADNGERVCVLTRGYGRENPSARVLVSDGSHILTDARSGGDEPVELAFKLLGKAVVVADADRVAAAAWASEKFGVTAFVLDDGYQHRRAQRDLDIVCIDGTNPFGNRRVLPAGHLREPLSNLKRAHATVVTRANMVKDIEKIRSEISKLGSSQVYTAESVITGVVPIERFPAGPQGTQNILGMKRIFAFCGLGNPRNFFDQLTRESVTLAGTTAFGDHHKYDETGIKALESAARRVNAECLVTTAKDAVKLSDLKFEIPCYVVEILTVIDDAEAFRQLITSS